MKYVRLFLLIVILLGLAILATPQGRAEINKKLSYSECDTPIGFKLGQLDPKFSLGQNQAMADIQKATDIWKNAYGKSLFLLTPDANLTVNFIYDERSALNAQISQQENQLNQKNSTLQQQINKFEADSADFEKRLATFNNQVKQVNASGGASPDQYNTLIAQQSELNSQAQELNNRAHQLNLDTKNYNSSVQNLNQNISQFNQALSQKPEEGLYNGKNNTITIYFVNTQQELIHTLAHEFGHALGMQHTADTTSLMYPLTSTYTTVKPDDLQQLNYVCRTQSLFSKWGRMFAFYMYNLYKKAQTTYSTK